jgi:DNA-binding MarR family transcriptional regulator
VDRRVHRVRLTDKAREFSPSIEQAYNQLYKIAMQGITQEELAEILQLFTRMSEHSSSAQANKIKEEHDVA